MRWICVTKWLLAVVCSRCIFVSSGFVLIFLLSVTNNENYFLRKEYIKEFFFLLSKTEIIFFKAKTFLLYLLKKKIKQFRFISKKEIIIFNYLRIFEEEVYYALYCPLNHIWPWNCPFDVDAHIKMYDLHLDLFVKIIFSITWPRNWHIGLLLKIILLHFWPRNWYFHDLELKLPLHMTLKMTFNHKNKAINGFFHLKSHEKEVLHMLPALFVQK